MVSGAAILRGAVPVAGRRLAALASAPPGMHGCVAVRRGRHVKGPGVIPHSIMNDIMANQDWMPMRVAAACDPGVSSRLWGLKTRARCLSLNQARSRTHVAISPPFLLVGVVD